MAKPYKLLKRKIAFGGKWFEAIIDSIELPGKEIYHYNYIVRRHNGVVVVPYFLKTKEVVLVNQYRHPVRKKLWGFPAGGQEKKQSFRQTAKKELKEEAGLIAKKLIDLGSFIPDPGVIGNQGRIFLALNPTFDQTKIENKTTEMITFKKLKLSEVEQMVIRGEIRDGWTMSAIYMLKLWEANPKRF